MIILRKAVKDMKNKGGKKVLIKKKLSMQVSAPNCTSKSFDFLKEDADLYNRNDLKVKYRK